VAGWEHRACIVELDTQPEAHARLHNPTTILIEDTGVGTALVQEFQNEGLPAIGVKPDQNKQTRMSIQSAKFESGQVFFPRSAPLLADLEAELFAFPGSRHDDQVDSVSQALAYEIKTSLWTAKSLEGFANFANAMAFDRYFGWMTGRPW
jgi:predicted phage terminase large subunit-like protein